MHEDVFATIIGGDKAVALLLFEPLDRYLGHVPSPPFSSWASSQQKAARVFGRTVFHGNYKLHLLFPPSTALALYQN